jgi:hypothetical protein
MLSTELSALSRTVVARFFQSSMAMSFIYGIRLFDCNSLAGLHNGLAL